jgi:hypothetical protein
MSYKQVLDEVYISHQSFEAHTFVVYLEQTIPTSKFGGQFLAVEVLGRHPSFT